MIYVMLCRDVDGGVEWPKVRAATNEWLEQTAEKLETADALKAPDPETWGMSPAQAAAQRRSMGQAGGGS